MASQISLADAQATPVTHNFVPAGRDRDGRYWFIDQSQSNALGFWRISVFEKFPKAPAPGESVANRNYRVEVALHEPVLETAGTSSTGYTAQPRVAYITRGLTEFILPEASALLDRKNIWKMNQLLMQNAQVQAVVENLTLIQ